MSEKFYKNEKFQKTFYAVLYLICAFSFIISGCFIFYKTYYTNVYVSGASMSPTLVGGTHGQKNSYGISDNHRVAIDNLKRFDVVITHYPSSWVGGDEDTIYKIKRVWGFPGETITMKYEDDKYTFTASVDDKVVYTISSSECSIRHDDGLGDIKVAVFNDGKRTFCTNAFSSVIYSPLRTSYTISLDKEKKEYFLMGDNWNSSSDSWTHLRYSEQITYNLIQGKVVAIQGVATVNSNHELVNKTRIRNMYYF